MRCQTRAVQIAVIVLCFGLAAADAYQAVTGRRLSKRPSRRTDQQMRRQSAIAAALLILLGVIEIVILVSN